MRYRNDKRVGDHGAKYRFKVTLESQSKKGHYWKVQHSSFSLLNLNLIAR